MKSYDDDVDAYLDSESAVEVRGTYEFTTKNNTDCVQSNPD